MFILHIELIVEHGVHEGRTTVFIRGRLLPEGLRSGAGSIVGEWCAFGDGGSGERELADQELVAVLARAL